MDGTETRRNPERERYAGRYGDVAAGRQTRAAKIASVVFTGVWLFYLIGAVAYLFSHHYSAPYVAGGLALIVVFSVLYLVLVPNWPAPRRYTLSGLALLALLATLGCVFYGASGMVVLWIFMSSASGLLVPEARWAARTVGGCIVCYVIFSATTHVGMTNFLSNLLPVLFIGFGMIGLRRQFRLTAELAMAREEVAQLAASEERLRLARDMHDLTRAVAVDHHAQVGARRPVARPTCQAARNRTASRTRSSRSPAVSRQTLRDIREAISGYRRPTLAVEIITARTALASAGITARDRCADLMSAFRHVRPETRRRRSPGACARRSPTSSGTLTRRTAGSASPAAPAPCHWRSATTARATPRRIHAASRPTGTGPLPSSRAHERAPVTYGSGLHGMSERLSAVGGTLELRPDLRPGFSLIASRPGDPACPSQPGSGDIIERVIRVLMLAEDQAMIREALAARLSSGGTTPRTPREELRVIL